MILVLHPTHSTMPLHIQMVLGSFLQSPQTHWYWCFFPPLSLSLIHKIWRCKLVHKPKLYISCNILSLVNHSLWTWDFLQLIKYYRSPFFVLIFVTLNHKLQLRNILHPFIWVSIWLHFFLWRSSSITMPSLKITNPYFKPYHLLWSKQHMSYKSLFCSQNLLIQH
jgi:hypothetical protein